MLNNVMLGNGQYLVLIVELKLATLVLELLARYLNVCQPVAMALRPKTNNVITATPLDALTAILIKGLHAL